MLPSNVCKLFICLFCFWLISSGMESLRKTSARWGFWYLVWLVHFTCSLPFSRQYLSLVMRKPVFALCSLISTFIVRYLDCSCYIRNFKPLASLWSWAKRFESYMVAHPEDRFSHDEAHFFEHPLYNILLSFMFLSVLSSFVVVLVFTALRRGV